MKSRSAVMEKWIIHTCASLMASATESAMLLAVPNGATVVNTTVPSSDASHLKRILVIHGIHLLSFLLRIRNTDCGNHMTETKSDDKEGKDEALLERHSFDDSVLMRLKR